MSLYFVSTNGKEHCVTIEPDGTAMVNGRPLACDIQVIDDTTISVCFNGSSTTYIGEKAGKDFRFLVRGNLIDVSVESQRERLIRQFDSTSSAQHKRTEIFAPMPALVVRLEVAVGDKVEKGQGVIILEAMKMENEIKSQSSGTVKTIFVTEGKPVEKGELLLLLE